VKLILSKTKFYLAAAFLLIWCGLIANLIAAQTRSLIPAQNSERDSLTVKALRAEAGKPSLYEVTFVTTDTLSPQAEFVLTFPADFDLRQLEIAGSSDINGGFALQRKGQEVRLRRTGLGAKVPPGKKVSMQLGLVVNPKNLAASHQVRVQLPAAASFAAANSRNKDVQFITPVK